jgi:hypothetical protein
VIFSQVIPGATGSAFVNKAAFFGHTTRGAIFGVDDKPDTARIQAAEQITHQQAGGPDKVEWIFL